MSRRSEMVHTAQTGDVLLVSTKSRDNGLQWEGVGVIINSTVFVHFEGQLLDTVDLGGFLDAMKAEHRSVGLFRAKDGIQFDTKKLVKDVTKELFKSPSFWQTMLNWSVKLIGKQPIYPSELKRAGVNLVLIVIKNVGAQGSTLLDLQNSNKLVRLL